MSSEAPVRGGSGWRGSTPDSFNPRPNRPGVGRESQRMAIDGQWTRGPLALRLNYLAPLAQPLSPATRAVGGWGRRFLGLAPQATCCRRYAAEGNAASRLANAPLCGVKCGNARHQPLFQG
jgi:hypothetical protein